MQSPVTPACRTLEMTVYKVQRGDDAFSQIRLLATNKDLTIKVHLDCHFQVAEVPSVSVQQQ
jgi:hypothetical protein